VCDPLNKGFVPLYWGLDSQRHVADRHGEDSNPANARWRGLFQSDANTPGLVEGKLLPYTLIAGRVNWWRIHNSSEPIHGPLCYVQISLPSFAGPIGWGRAGAPTTTYIVRARPTGKISTMFPMVQSVLRGY
jgi:hypothetical protein